MRVVLASILGVSLVVSGMEDSLVVSGMANAAGTGGFMGVHVMRVLSFWGECALAWYVYAQLHAQRKLV